MADAPQAGSVTGVNIAARTVGLTKTYGTGDTAVTALDAVDFEVLRGEFTAIMGPSGSGKSTLMHLMAALDTPTSGSVYIGDTDVATLKDTPLTKLRRNRIGFVFQAFNLVPTLTAKENIILPLAIAGKSVDQQLFDRVIDVLGLGNRLQHKPSELSGGQQQRVACARALMNEPDIVFADEPTGNLDTAAAQEILAFLRRSVDEFGQTVVLVTHDAHAASYADRVVFLSDGRILDDLRGGTQEDLLQAMAGLYPRSGPEPDVPEEIYVSATHPVPRPSTSPGSQATPETVETIMPAEIRESPEEPTSEPSPATTGSDQDVPAAASRAVRGVAFEDEPPSGSSGAPRPMRSADEPSWEVDDPESPTVAARGERSVAKDADSDQITKSKRTRPRRAFLD